MIALSDEGVVVGWGWVGFGAGWEMLLKARIDALSDEGVVG